MSVNHPGGDPNANLYAQLKRDVLDRVPHITTVEYVPDEIEATKLRAVFDPDRLTPPTGPKSPELTVAWYRGTPHDWFRVNYVDPNTGFHAGWHQDEDHPDLGRAHFQYATDEAEDRWGITFEHETPSLILWEIIEDLLEDVHPVGSMREFRGLELEHDDERPATAILREERDRRSGAEKIERRSDEAADE